MKQHINKLPPSLSLCVVYFYEGYSRTGTLSHHHYCLLQRGHGLLAHV